MKCSGQSPHDQKIVLGIVHEDGLRNHGEISEIYSHARTHSYQQLTALFLSYYNALKLPKSTVEKGHKTTIYNYITWTFI